MVEQGKIDKNDKVVCYVTGNGLKATESIMQVLPQPTVYKPNINEISRRWFNNMANITFTIPSVLNAGGGEKKN